MALPCNGPRYDGRHESVVVSPPGLVQQAKPSHLAKERPEPVAQTVSRASLHDEVHDSHSAMARGRRVGDLPGAGTIQGQPERYQH